MRLHVVIGELEITRIFHQQKPDAKLEAADKIVGNVCRLVELTSISEAQALLQSIVNDLAEAR